MAIGSGLGGQVGAAAETAYGTYKAPDHFYKVTKSELKKVLPPVQGAGLAAGQMTESASRRVYPTQAATGSLEMQVGTSSFGLWLQHIFGSSTAPAQQGATAAYLQTHTLGDNFGKSLTIQNGIPNRGGTVLPYTLKGGKVTSATFSCKVNEILNLALEVDGQLLSEVETLAAASFPAGITPFHGGQMTVKLGAFGSEAVVSGVKGISAQIQRGQQVDGYYAGATILGTKSEPVMNDYVNVTGSLDVDLVNKADFFDRFASGAATSLVISWTGAVIASTYNYALTLTMPATFFTGDSPMLEGPDVVSGSIPFDAKFDPTNGTINATYMSTDITI